MHGFSYGIIYYTYRRRNTFISVYKMSEQGLKHLIFKSSIGFTSFRGPKKGTSQAKEEVAKHAGRFIKSRNCDLTFVDIIFTKIFSRGFLVSVLKLLPSKIKVQQIIHHRRHPHGYNRGRKSKRK